MAGGLVVSLRGCWGTHAGEDPITFMVGTQNYRLVNELVLLQILKLKAFYKEIVVFKARSFIICTRTSCFNSL